MPEAIPASDQDSVRSPSACYKCGADLDVRSPDVCRLCGRRQTRQCFCGTTIQRGPVVCPECGADWRRMRRGSRSSGRRISGRDLMANAVAGGLVALAVAALLYFLATGGARSIAATVSSALASAWPRISQVAAEAAVPLAVFAFGCFIGIARYYFSLKTRRHGRRPMLPRKRSEGTE